MSELHFKKNQWRRFFDGKVIPALFVLLLTGILTPNAFAFSRNLYTASSNDVLSGWPAANAVDWNFSTNYSSNSFTSSMNTRGSYIAAWANSAQSVWQVVLVARMIDGVPAGFPPTYQLSVTNPNNTAWINLGTFNTQPNSSGYAVIQLPEIYQTWGIMVTPESIGQDNYENYYFQLADSTVANSQVFTTAGSNDVASGSSYNNAIDGNPATFYTSNTYTTPNSTRGTYLAAWASSVQTISQIQLTANMVGGVPKGFPIVYQVSVTNPQNSAWINLGSFTDQPNSLGVATITLSQPYQTYGVMIKPIVLGAVSKTNYGFVVGDVTASNTGFPSFGAFSLNSNQSIGITSTLTLQLQTNGNLVLSNSSGTVIWSTGTTTQSCTSGCNATFANGILTLSKGGTTYWSTNTPHTAGAQLVFTTQSPYVFITSSGGTNSLWPSLKSGMYIAYTVKMTNNPAYPEKMIFSSDGNLRLYGNTGPSQTVFPVLFSTMLSNQSCGNGGCTARFFPGGQINLYKGSTLYYTVPGFGN